MYSTRSGRCSRGGSRFVVDFDRLYAALVDDETSDDDAAAPPAPDEIELTPEEVGEKYERLLMRAARSYLLAKRLTKLLDADITFKESGTIHVLRTRNGMLLSASDAHTGKTDAVPNTRWHGLSIETFDRLRVLNTELARVAGDDDLISVHYL